jgi:ATPase family associated with various cellular activities (AAA)
MSEEEAHYSAYQKDSQNRWWFYDERQIQERLAADFYFIAQTSMGYYLQSRPLASDEIVELPNPHTARVLSIVEKFLNDEFAASMAEMKMVNKLAMLLWGDPGTSKSVTIYTIIKQAIENDCVIIEGNHPVHIKNAINNIRLIEPDRKILVIWEEFDHFARDATDEMLQLLDGPDQIPGVLYIMTTNFIKNVPERIFLRCRRIPFQEQFGYPNNEERRVFFDKKIPESRRADVDIEDWVSRTEGLSIDHCAQLLVGTFAFNQTIEEVLEDLRCRMRALGKPDDFRSLQSDAMEAMRDEGDYDDDKEPYDTPSAPATAKM